MFDFAWSEIALIGVVALIAIGPKDMPVAIKTVSQFVKKARRMASEFQTHVDEMVREADLGEVRDTVRNLRSFDLRGTIEKHVDSDGSIRRAFDDPMTANPGWQPNATTWEPPKTEEASTESSPAGVGVTEPSTAGVGVTESPRPEVDAALAFVPPWVQEARAAREAAPAFIPPGVVRDTDA
jgi:sec-independent protein translocase protein TatB